MKLRSTLAAFAAVAVLATPVIAAGPFADMDAGPTSIDFRPAVSGVALTLTVSGPEGFRFERSFAPGEVASFSVFDAAGDFLPAGSYTWELRAAPELSDAERAQRADLRDAGGDPAALRKAGKLRAAYEPLSGAFRVERGAIVAGGEVEAGGSTPAPAGGNRLAQKTQVINMDLIVQGSECVGIDCTASENFGFDTIRLKENNLRIKFEDTSNSGSFPSNDWQLTANDSANGGLNKFSIDDITGGRTPFTVEAGAPTNSLYVDDAGNWGQGTSSPALQIHVVDGNTPALRLEQNGSSGFTPQTWDVAGNEANFFIRDVTNGSQLAFRIEPGADESSIHIDSDNDVGIGTSNPTANLHVKDGSAEVIWADVTGVGIGTAAPSRPLEIVAVGASDNTVLEFSNDGPARMRMVNGSTSETWNFGHQAPSGTGLVMSDVGDSDSEFLLDVSGNLTITGALTTGGMTCGSGCDLVFAPEYEMPTIEEHAAAMWANRYLPEVGPTPENQPFNLTEKLGGVLNELEKAHIFIAQLSEEKDAEIDALRSEVEQLRTLVHELTAREDVP